jgi:hypothetical protein
MKTNELVQLKGHIDAFVPPNRIVGWVRSSPDADEATPDLKVVAKSGDHVFGSAAANLHRQDLEVLGSGHFGFDMICDGGLPAQWVSSGLVNVEVHSAGQVRGKLEFQQLSRDIAALYGMAQLYENVLNHSSSEVRHALAHVTPNIKHGILTKLQSTVMSLAGEMLPASAGDNTPQLCPIIIRSGLISSDGAATIGREGHVFLTGGSNALLEQYQAAWDDPNIEQLAEKWMSLFHSRKKAAREIGAEFYQMIIPDKLTLARELYDGDLSRPTTLLSRIENKFGRSPDPAYLSALDCLSQLPFGTSHRKIDSHLSAQGSYAIFHCVTDALGEKMPQHIHFAVPDVWGGDLTDRFFGQPLFEEVKLAAVPSFANSRAVVECNEPPGGYIGGKVVFRNPAAPIKKKLVAFGNSFTGGYASSDIQGSVSFWFSRWFEEYHFLFHPEMDKAYINSVRPDVVFCQTVERFIPVVPAT